MNIKSVKKQIIKKSEEICEANTLIVTYENDLISYVPIDESNEEYKRILTWISGGNKIEEYKIGFDIIEPQELTVQEKLQAAGLTIEELKEALGL
jgi:hypothetical protein